MFINYDINKFQNVQFLIIEIFGKQLKENVHYIEFKIRLGTTTDHYVQNSKIP